MAEQEHFYAKLGARIRARRERIGFTQAEVADAIGISRTSLTNIESGRQRVLVDQLVALSRKLTISVVDLIPADDVKAEASSRRVADLPVVTNFVQAVLGERAR